MSMAIDKQVEPINATRGIANHDYDMIYELGKRLDSLWKFDQYIANAEGDEQLQNFWSQLKIQEADNISQLKKLVALHAARNCCLRNPVRSGSFHW
jgi:hypothetical protein